MIFYKARVASKDLISMKVIRVHLNLIKPLSMDFISGQFISINIKEGVKRSYSITSSPNGTANFDLVVDISPAGAGSKFFENLKVGDIINFLGPMGKFTLHSETGNIVFLAAGTGIAPIKSMIGYLLEKQEKNHDFQARKIYTYLGFRYLEDIFYKDYFENLTKKHPNFFFKLILSRPVDGWIGDCGYVQNFIETKILQDPNSHFYVCGGGAMVKGVTQFLKSKQVNCERIHFEPF